VERFVVPFPEEAVIFPFAATARLALKPTQLPKVWIRGRGGESVLHHGSERIEAYTTSRKFFTASAY
jgi:hypothetical protein